MTFVFGVSLVSPALAEEAEKKGMPQLDPSSYASQLFWLAVFFVLFYGFMWLVAMPRLARIVGSREARISDDLNHATTASGEAEALKAELDARLARSREESRALLAAANDEIRARATAEDAALSAELARRIGAAEASIAAARGQALAAVSEIASGIVVAAVPKLAAVHADNAEASAAVARTGQRK